MGEKLVVTRAAQRASSLRPPVAQGPPHRITGSGPDRPAPAWLGADFSGLPATEGLPGSTLLATVRCSPSERQAADVAAGGQAGVLANPAVGARPLAPAVIDAVRRGLSDGGAPLPEAVRHGAEARTGMDFSGVRVHAGERAAASASTLGAEAFTVGGHVVLGHGRPSPASPANSRLLAHELTHVAQQAASGQRVLARQEAQTAEDTGDRDAGVSLGALDNPLVARTAESLVGDTGWAVLREFLRGMWGGLTSVPPEQMARIQKKADDFGVVEGLKYAGGYLVGIGEGLWLSVKGLAEAIWTLLKLPYAATEFVFNTLPELAAKYGPRIQNALAESSALSDRLGGLLKGFLDHPRESFQQLSGFLDAVKNLALAKVRALGRATSGKLLELIEEPWYDYGRDIGKVVGQILFEVILAVASEGIATAVKSGLRIAGELAARAVTGAVEVLRNVGRLLGQALEWTQGIGRRLAGEAGELFETIKALLGRLKAIFGEMVEESAVAETGAGNVKVAVPEAKGASVLESRAVKPPRTSPATVADLKPPKVHPSNLPAGPSQPGFPPRAPGTPSRFADEEIAGELAEQGELPEVRAKEAMGQSREVTAVQKRTAGPAGTARQPRHHVYPKEERPWFEERGFTGEHDIDNYTVEMKGAHHEAQHAGRGIELPPSEKPWEWNRMIMDELRKAERAAKRKLTRAEIMKIVEKRMKIRKIPKAYVPWKAGREP